MEYKILKRERDMLDDLRKLLKRVHEAVGSLPDDHTPKTIPEDILAYATSATRNKEFWNRAYKERMVRVVELVEEVKTEDPSLFDFQTTNPYLNKIADCAFLASLHDKLFVIIHHFERDID